MAIVTPTFPATLLTAEDLLRLDAQGVRGELVRGVFCETMSAGQLHGKLALRLGARLLDHAEAHGLGTVVGTDSGILLEHDPDTVREPDLAFTATARLPPGQVSDGYAEVVPDLVVEVASPNDRLGELAERAAMWLGFGVRLVWVVHPGSKTVDIRSVGTEAVESLTEADSLDGGSVLPGFTCPLSQLFAD